MRLPVPILAAAITLSSLAVATAGVPALDLGFDGDGVARFRHGGIMDKATGLVRLADGRIVVVGSEVTEASNAFYGISSDPRRGVAVARYLSNGALDTSFGLAGFTVVDGDGTGAAAVAVEAGGTLLVGNTAIADGGRRLQVLRLTSGGVPTAGDVYRHPSLGADELTALVVQPDGKIVIAGNVTSGGVRRIVVVRLNADLTFDAGGLVAGFLGEAIEASALALEVDGRILVGGRHRVGPQTSALVMRLAADLSATDGSADLLASTVGNPRLRALLVEPDGKIIGVGTAAGEDSDDAVIVRLTTSLALAGSTLAGGSSAADVFTSVVRQGDGKLAAIGTKGVQGNDVLCARFNADLTVDGGFDAGDLPHGKGIHEGVALALQPDGKLLAAANAAIPPEDSFDVYDYTGDNAALVRLNGDGSLDPSFASTIPSDARIEETFAATAVAAEPGGGVAFAAVPNYRTLSVNAPPDDFTVGRVDAAGTLDLAFGANGFATADFGAIDRANAILRQGDGKYVVAGSSETIDDSGFITITHSAFAIARFAGGGALDATFSGDGKATTLFTGGAEGAWETLLQQSDGKIVALGAIRNVFDIALARYDDTGALDAGFGTGGRKTGPVRCFGVRAALQPDDKIVAACHSTNLAGTTSELSIVRYMPNGSVDGTFGTGGVVVLDVANDGGEHVAGVFVQPDTTILVAGSTTGTTTFGADDVFLVRLASDGTPDATFGTGGVVQTDIASGSEYAVTAVQDADGKTIVVGIQNPNTFVHRYAADGTLDGGFGVGGIEAGQLTAVDVLPLHATVTTDGALVVSGEDSQRYDYKGAATLARLYAGSCGNGTTEAGEACDDGDLTSDDGCDANCTPTACGNGVLTSGETCDDGNAVGGDCCDAACQLEANGSPCGADPCTTGATCTAGVCGGGAAVTCGTCERCDAGVGCVANLRTSCLSTDVEGASSLAIKDSPLDAKDQLQWQIKKGDFLLLSEYGNPVPNGGDDYALCVFDVSGLDPQLLIASSIPAGGSCQGRPCWTAGDDVLKYKEKTGANGGVTQITLKRSDFSPSSQSLKGKGAGLALPKLSLPTPLRVQLQAEGAQCFEDAYVTPSKNTYKQYKAAGEF